MALLIATRLWSHLWRTRRVSLRLRSDNIGALTVFSACKGAPGAMNTVAREYALDAAEGSFEPQLIDHLPGITNQAADILSRRLDPKHARGWKVHPFLANAERIEPPPRPLSWWRSLLPPGTSSYSGS